MQSVDWMLGDSGRIVNVKYLTELIGLKATLLLMYLGMLLIFNRFIVPFASEMIAACVV